MKYRSRTAITVMILDTANKETTKVKIMYNAYLLSSVKRLSYYIRENELIEYLDGNQIFRTTEKRKNY